MRLCVSAMSRVFIGPRVCPLYPAPSAPKRVEDCCWSPEKISFTRGAYQVESYHEGKSNILEIQFGTLFGGPTTRRRTKKTGLKFEVASPAHPSWVVGQTVNYSELKGPPSHRKMLFLFSSSCLKSELHQSKLDCNQKMFDIPMPGWHLGHWAHRAHERDRSCRSALVQR